MLRKLLFLLLVILLAACNLSVPEVTPTVAPSRTPSNTPVVSSTPSTTPRATEVLMLVTPSLTPSPDSTQTPLPTDTPTVTNTPRPTNTATVTPLPSDTPMQPTDTPTVTPSLTDTPTGTTPPTDTPLPTFTPFPTDTPTPIPTETPVPSPTLLPLPTDTPPPTLTPLPSQTPTNTDAPPVPDTMTPNFTPSPGVTPQRQLPTNLPQIGALPSPTPRNETPEPAPTLDVTPVFITVNAPVPLFNATPIPASSTPEAQPTVTLTETAAAATPTLLPQTVGLPSTSDFLLSNSIEPGTLAYVLNPNGAGFSGNPFPSLIPNPMLLAQNPANPNEYVAVTNMGQILHIPDYAGNRVERLNIDIFTEHHYAPMESIENNDKPVLAVEWSVDGKLAFIVDGDSGDDDGVWYWTPDGEQRQLLAECPDPDNCTVIERRGLSRWDSDDIAWSPPAETQPDALLVTLDLPDNGRRALIVIDPETANWQVIPPLLMYDYGSWSADGSQIIVSGRAPDGTMVIGRVNRDGGNPQLINMSERGFGWTQSAVEFNGQVYGFASSGGDAPVQLVDGSGNALTGTIGSRRPERIEWSPDNRAALIVINEDDRLRYYVQQIGQPAAQEITEVVAQAATVQWIGQPSVPQGAQIQPTVPPPPPVPPTEAPLFAPGQLVTANSELNLRDAPSVDGNIMRVLQAGDILRIISGPVVDGTLEWYQVDYQGVGGYVAGVIEGVPYLR